MLATKRESLRTTAEHSNKPVILVREPQKSVTLAVGLATLFGPVGLLYSAPWHALIFVAVGIFEAGLFDGIVVAWLVGIPIAWVEARAHNLEASRRFARKLRVIDNQRRRPD